MSIEEKNELIMMIEDVNHDIIIREELFTILLEEKIKDNYNCGELLNNG
jgi:hypothetical protein